MADAVAGLPVYRTYVEPGAEEVERARPRGRRGGRAARARARGAGRPRATPDEEAFAVRFQQTTGAVMAKGVEDTALYRYLRLAALNEVGGDPGRWGAVARRGARAQRRRAARRFPRGLLATQTHDTKRSGDVRARIGALAARARAPGASGCCRWRELNAPLRARRRPHARTRST